MNRSAGYTLIEVLIMLAVTAILAATVLETVRASTSNGLRIEQAARNAAQDYITLASVRRAVQASRADYRDGDHRFDGDETRFSALTSYPITTERPRLQPYTLSLVNTSDGVSLVYEEQGERFSIQFWPGGRGEWSYFVEEQEAQAGFMQRIGEPNERRWVSNWPARTLSGAQRQQNYFQSIPLAARAEIELANGERRVMVFQMPITAAPRPRIQDLIGSLPQ